MTKTEESHMLRDIKRTAAATERIAKALERIASNVSPTAEDYFDLAEAYDEGMRAAIECAGGNEAGMKEDADENKNPYEERL